MELMRGGQPISLTCHEFKILKFMMQNPERLISREELLREVWGYRNYPRTRTVDTHMLKLRSKTGERPFGSCAFQNRPQLRLQVRALRRQPNCEWGRKSATLPGTTSSICLTEKTHGPRRPVLHHTWNGPMPEYLWPASSHPRTRPQVSTYGQDFLRIR
jgi:hypothetical protein